jgi:hypothetical protein
MTTRPPRFGQLSAVSRPPGLTLGGRNFALDENRHNLGFEIHVQRFAFIYHRKVVHYSPLAKAAVPLYGGDRLRQGLV